MPAEFPGTDIPPVQHIGRYEIAAEIGRGSMGVVYLARDPRLHREVALKTFELPAALGPERRAEYQERFLREARAAASLSHPGIVTVYDVDWDASRGTPFLAMEHVPGGTLRDLLERRGRLDPQEALALVDSLAAALGVAHEAGIVHRDVKPANILLDRDETVKIADFGVARYSTSELTRSGATLGSPAYMSPEQIRGKRVDGRSDLFSLGVIFYEAICGTRPFVADDVSALAYAVVHESPVPASRAAGGLPPAIDRFLDRALAKDPAERFADAAQFRDALRRLREEISRPVADSEATQHDGVPSAGAVDPPPAYGSGTAPTDGVAFPFADPAPDPKRRRLLVAGLAFALVLVLAGWWLLGGDDAHLRLEGKSTVPEGSVRLLVDGEEVYARELAGGSGGGGLVNKVLRKNQETFEAWIEVQSGKREITARLEPEANDSVYTDTIVVDLEPNETKKLRMVAGRALGRPLSLKID